MFRNYEGNFYTALIYSVKQLVNENAGDPEQYEEDNLPPRLK
jgi:hypothetical protein